MSATDAFQSLLIYRFFREIASQLSMRRFDSGIRSKALDVKCLELLKSDSNLLNDF